MRCSLIARFLAATWLAFTVAGLPFASAAEKNVVVVVADDLGLQLGCYGDQVAKTPHLDALAADATLFTHAFCTTASCSPSRSVLLSGMHNHANGMYGLAHGEHHFSSFDRLQTLTARLSKAGYRTASIGKTHVTPATVYPFDKTIPGNSRNGVQMANNCREFLAAADERPFFLWFGATDPHRARGIGPAPYKPNLFGNEDPHPGITEQTFRPQDVIVPSFLPDTPTVRAELAEYYQSSARFDQGVGHLIQILKDAGRWDDTLLMVLSDNGMAFPGGKTTLYEPGMRLPCLIRNPYLAKRGVRNSAMISWVDIAPTILEFAGATDRRPKLHGRSFLGVLEQPEPGGWDEVYGSHTFHEVTMYYPMRVVRTRKYKLIWNIAHPLPFASASDLFTGATWQEAISKGLDSQYGQRTVKQYLQRPQFELYDLVNDPGETQNLAADANHAETLAQLKAKLKAFQERTGDPWLLKWQYE
jgi:N-sulfoglucosamine sulfohydrolase